jgi:hypothetical protein
LFLPDGSLSQRTPSGYCLKLNIIVLFPQKLQPPTRRNFHREPSVHDLAAEFEHAAEELSATLKPSSPNWRRPKQPKLDPPKPPRQTSPKHPMRTSTQRQRSWPTVPIRAKHRQPTSSGPMRPRRSSATRSTSKVPYCHLLSLLDWSAPGRTKHALPNARWHRRGDSNPQLLEPVQTNIESERISGPLNSQ